MKKGYHRTKSGKIARKGLWYNVNQRKKKGISRTKSKTSARRKSFCARMLGMKKRLTSKKKARDPNSRINKALRKWDC